MGDTERRTDQENLKTIMDNFSISTELSIVAVNLYGEPFLASTQYEENEFCQYIRATPEGGERCRKCYRKACKAAFEWEEPYYFRCHAGLVMWALPLSIGQEELGAIICGQVLLWKADHLFLNEIKDLHHYVRQPEELFDRARKLKVISSRQCQAAAELLRSVVENLCNTYYYVLIEQKNKMNWEKQVLNQIYIRKKNYADAHFDRAVYLKRERSFLQYVRMRNKEKIDELFPILYTDIELLCAHDQAEIKLMVRDFMVLVSRACAEAGLEADLAQKMLRQYEKKAAPVNRSEKIYAVSYEMICNYFDMIYCSADEVHTGLLQEILSYIQHHYREDITLEQIARKVGLSKPYLCTMFRIHMNTTVNGYLTRVRVEQSIELMRDRSRTIGEVGKLCGFASQSHYTRVFKKQMGLSPGQYRNQFLS